MRIAHLRSRPDEGAALITVIALGAIVAGLVVLAGSITANSLSNSRQHVAFNQALDVAETGLEQMLARLQASRKLGVAYSEPAGLTVVTSPTMTAEQVDQAARQKILDLVAADPTVVQQSPTGEYVSIAPADRRVVYSMSWVPNRAEARSSRFLKTEYLFSTYRPATAILTGGDLEFSGSVEVIGSDADPTLEAPVHANGSIDITNNSLTVTGSVTASGDLTGHTGGLPAGSGDQQSPLDIPDVEPELLYQELAHDVEYVNRWVDLCPNGDMRAPSTTPGALPCTGTPVLATAATTSTGSGFQGWRWSVVDGVSTWSDGNQHENLVYYAHQGNVDIDDNANLTWQSTVIASSTGPCGSKLGGNIFHKNQDMEPLIPGLMFMAGQDLVVRASATLGTESNPGLVAAADQVDLDTSSAVIYGAVLAADSCPDTPGSPASQPNVVQGITIKFGGGLDTPVAALIRTVLWLEMPAAG